MLVRICSAALLSFFLFSGAAQAQASQTSFRSLIKVPDPRAEFVRLCAPHMVGRWAHPESVCSCLHDYAAATVEDADLREALLRGIRETGVTFTKSAKPSLLCMFEPAIYQYRASAAELPVSRHASHGHCKDWSAN